MIKNLSVSSGKVNWSFDNKEINLEIQDVFFASEYEGTKLIRIDTGKNFIESKVFYYNFEGELELYYDLDICTIEWSVQSIKKKIVIEDMKQVGFFPQSKRLFILCNSKKQGLYGYDMEGNQLFKVNSPDGFKMLYFTKLKGEVAIVCDGDKDQEDAFGRYRYNFLIDVNNGKLSKGTLAY